MGALLKFAVPCLVACAFVLGYGYYAMMGGPPSWAALTPPL